jgi:hypothetical protein
VKFVKSNFIGGRTFYDPADLEQELANWLKKVNYQRECEATGKIPAELLAQERVRLGKLPVQAQDYGFFECLVVNREGFVTYETNKYSVPARLIGQALSARIFKERIEIYVLDQQVASHPRSKHRQERVVVPAHFEAAFTHKPRARVMVYRDWLVKLSPTVAEYVSEICRSQRGRMNQQIVEMYRLAQQLGSADFVSALELAAEQQLVGAEYISAIALGTENSAEATKPDSALPSQKEIERELAQYARYVANLPALERPCEMLVGGGNSNE